MKLRQVARAWKTSDLMVGTVKFERFAPDVPFGRLAGEWNGLELTTRTGHKHYTVGRGAGRWPTTEAVTADLFDLFRCWVART
jgi:homoserine dehydrogenase